MDYSAIIVALITLVGVVISAFVTKNNLYHELDKKDALMAQRLEQIDEHLREHNHYAALFSETAGDIRVIHEQINTINRRMEVIEHSNKDK